MFNLKITELVKLISLNLGKNVKLKNQPSRWIPLTIQHIRQAIKKNKQFISKKEKKRKEVHNYKKEQKIRNPKGRRGWELSQHGW